MDADRFDDLARALAATASRRAVLRRLAGTAAGGALALLAGGRLVAAQDGDRAAEIRAGGGAGGAVRAEAARGPPGRQVRCPRALCEPPR